MENREIQKTFLFADLRHISCGALSWLTAEGGRHGVANPPGDPVPLHAEPTHIPHGIRFVAQPARKAGLMSDYRGWGRVIHDGGRYRSWYLEINGHSKLGSGSAAHAQPPQSVAICAVESEDGYHWREPERCPIRVPGLRQYQLMFPMVWHRYTERSEVRLYSSADGRRGARRPRGH